MAFQPMEVQVFEPHLDMEELTFQPQDVFRVGGTDQGFHLSPEMLGGIVFTSIRGISVFRSLETGADKTFLMWVMDGSHRPLVAEIQQIQFAEFPIDQSTTATETLRQLVLYVCQKAGRMVMDRSTGVFLQQGGPPPLLEKRILALATALARTVAPTAPAASAPAIPAVSAPAAPSTEWTSPFAEVPQTSPVGEIDSSMTPATSVAAQLPSPPVAPPVNPDPVAALSYSQTQAFFYPLRGFCLFVLLGMTLLTLLSLVASGLDNPEAGNPNIGVNILINLVSLWLVPSILFAVIRDTAHGANSLREFPRLTDIGQRLRDIGAYLLASLVPMAVSVLLVVVLVLPAAVLLVQQQQELLQSQEVNIQGPLALAAAFLLIQGLLLGTWWMTMGAIAVYGGPLLAIRLDLHVRALGKTWRPLLRLLLAFGAVSVSCVLLSTALAVKSTPDSMSAMLPVFLPMIFGFWYTMLVSIHRVGLVFRNREPELTVIYSSR